MKLRMREFGLIYIAYMGFLIARKNYGFWLPSVLSELGKGKGEAGALGSTFEMTYGAASLLNGVLVTYSTTISTLFRQAHRPLSQCAAPLIALPWCSQIDVASPKHFLVGGLVLSGLCSVCIGSTTSLPVMVVIWGANGIIQSFGWPSITNIFLSWFPDPASRGAWYSLLSTCQNVGAALVPLLVSSCMSRWGWKAALYAPAGASFAFALALSLLLYGSPEAVQNASMRGPTAPAPRTSTSLTRMLSEQVVMNPALWLMAVNYFGVSMVRTCMSDWSNVFLREEKGLPLATAARCLFLMEIGGFAGSLTAGAMSDKLFRGRRGPIVCTCSFLLAPVLFALVSLESPLLIQVSPSPFMHPRSCIPVHASGDHEAADRSLSAAASVRVCLDGISIPGIQGGGTHLLSVSVDSLLAPGMLPLPWFLRVPGACAVGSVLARGCPSGCKQLSRWFRQVHRPDRRCVCGLPIGRVAAACRVGWGSQRFGDRFDAGGVGGAPIVVHHSAESHSCPQRHRSGFRQDAQQNVLEDVAPFATAPWSHEDLGPRAAGASLLRSLSWVRRFIMPWVPFISHQCRV